MAQRLVQDRHAPVLRGTGTPFATQRRARLLGLHERLQLVERDPEQLAQTDQLLETLDVGVAVDAVLASRPLTRIGKQAALLVVPDRAGSRSCPLGNLSDSHVLSVADAYVNVSFVRPRAPPAGGRRKNSSPPCALTP